MIPPDLRTRLTAAIEGDSLVFVCGAGLSAAPPTLLPQARAVALKCFNRWQAIESDLDVRLRDDLGGLAAYFYDKGLIEKFVELVPWEELGGHWNPGHAAIGDFLTCRAAFAAISTNFDSQIENWAEELRGTLRGALTGTDAVNFGVKASPLLKVHGCIRNRTSTIWTENQINDAPIRLRLDNCKAWMGMSLAGKDIVVIGYWTDWKYLNKVIEAALSTTQASSVTVVDTASSAELEQRAPALWSLLNGLSAEFRHVCGSGADFLAELRAHFSRGWIRKCYQVAHAPATLNPLTDGLDADELYDLRRDTEGVDRTRTATLKAPPVSVEAAAAFQLELLQNGAVRDGAWFGFLGRRVRVVNGAGRSIGEVRKSFVEPPALSMPDLVVCAGAESYGVPTSLVRPGLGASTVRPAPGGGGTWMTTDEARKELAL